jgi:hypothetical protein
MNNILPTNQSIDICRTSIWAFVKDSRATAMPAPIVLDNIACGNYKAIHADLLPC